MADTIDPRLAVPGSVTEAQNAFLGLLEPEEEKPQAEDSAPAEDVEESNEETQDESSEEVSELDESTEEEEESDDEVEESEEEESDDVEDEERLYAVTIDGEQHEVSLDELRKGYSRQSDYTRKTQELAEQRKQIEQYAQVVESEIHQTQQFRQQYIDAANLIIQRQYGKINDLMRNTDWERLKVEDREEYLTKKSELSDLQAEMQRDQYDLEQAQQQSMQEQHAQMEQVVAQEQQKLVEIIPQWRDEKFRINAAKQISEFAISQGFTQDEINQLADHRSLIVLMQAKAYNDLMNAQQTTKQKKVAKKAKMASSGTGVNKKKETQKVKRTAQMKRLKQSGKPEDAASLFEDFVDI